MRHREQGSVLVGHLSPCRTATAVVIPSLHYFARGFERPRGYTTESKRISYLGTSARVRGDARAVVIATSKDLVHAFAAFLLCAACGDAQKDVTLPSRKPDKHALERYPGRHPALHRSRLPC